MELGHAKSIGALMKDRNIVLRGADAATAGGLGPRNHEAVLHLKHDQATR